MNNIFTKIFLVVVVSWLFLSFAPARAENKDIAPEFNPICWKMDECAKMRTELFGIEDPVKAREGFLPRVTPCTDEGWGKCLPAGTTQASISFGGKKEFAHIGDYIVTVYNYALRIAAILALVMIIIAGVQYVTSGGNSEMISSAKKRIFGSLIGLFIAYMSFFILNSINPALVELRLPQIYMIKPQVLSPEFCVDVSTTTLFADSGKAGGEILDKAAAYNSLTSAKFNLDWKTVNGTKTEDGTEDGIDCGEKQLFLANSGGAVCVSSFCKKPKGGIPQMCVSRAQESVQAEKKPYGCMQANIYGDVHYSIHPPACVGQVLANTEGWLDLPTDISETELWAVCNDGSTTDVSKNTEGFDSSDKTQVFYIAYDETSLLEACGNQSQLKGFVLMFEMDEACDPTDEEHLIGWKSGDDGGVVDLGDEGFFDAHVKEIPKEYFFSLAQVISPNGVRIKMDAHDVHDMDVVPEDYQQYNDLIGKK